MLVSCYLFAGVMFFERLDYILGVKVFFCMLWA